VILGGQTGPEPCSSCRSSSRPDLPFAATLEVRNSTLADPSNQDGGQASVELIQRLSRTAALLKVVMVQNDGALQEVLDQQKALLASVSPWISPSAWHRGRPPRCRVLLDGRRSNSGQIAAGYASQVFQDYVPSMGEGRPSTLNVRNLYNPNLGFKWHVLPSWWPSSPPSAASS